MNSKAIVTSFVAGIGSRETPADVLADMREIGAVVLNSGLTLTSGHADGADWAFEEGAQYACIAYLPWASFNAQMKSKARKVVPKFEQKHYDLAAKFHPAWERLGQGAQKLMARNGCQVLGEGLDEKAEAVICWTKDGKASGGTGQALRIAEAYGIPVFNLKVCNKQDVLNFLENLVGPDPGW
jgi:hypothetical protein